MPFRFDLSDFLIYGGKNFVVVRIDASFGDGWFYDGAGIYRHVWLTKTDPLHLCRWESYVRTEIKSDATMLSLGTIVENQTTQSANPPVHWQILDNEGKTVAFAHTEPQAIGRCDIQRRRTATLAFALVARDALSLLRHRYG